MAKRLLLRLLLKKDFPNTLNIIVFAVAFCFLSLCCFGAFSMFWQASWRADSSKWSAKGVFQMALGQAPSPGVTNIQVSGRHYFLKRWVWMRFQATHPAMKLLALIGTPISSAEAREFLHEDRTANKRYNDADRQKINWSSIEHVAHPVAYEFYLLKSSPWTWHGILVLDYPNQTGYVQALGD